MAVTEGAGGDGYLSFLELSDSFGTRGDESDRAPHDAPASRGARAVVVGREIGGGSAESAEALRGLIFAEFDPILGPIIASAYPEGVLTADKFSAIAEYVISKPELYARVVGINVAGVKVIGCPVSVSGPSYKRNAYLFNLAVIVDAFADPLPYHSIVSKAAAMLQGLETKNKFLSMDKTREGIINIMKTMYTSLVASGACSFFVDEAHGLHGVLAPQSPVPATVSDASVPVLIADMAVPPQELELTLARILPFIDGVRYVKAIAIESEVDLTLVRQVLQNLLHWGYVRMVDIFQYSNVYTPTGNVGSLLTNHVLAAECLSVVVGRAKVGWVETTVARVFEVYCSMQPGVTVRKLMTTAKLARLGIDERQLVVFGVLNGLIRRVHTYPVRVSPSPLTAANLSEAEVSHLASLLDGRSTLDAICVALSLSTKVLLDIFAKDGQVCLLHS